MRKRFICLVLILTTACGGPFLVRKQQPVKFSFAKYNNLFVGWIDFEPYNWKLFGFKNKRQWTRIIKKANINGLHVYVKKFMPELKIKNSFSSADYYRYRRGIYIKFTSVQLSPGFDSMFLNIHFIDMASKKIIYTTSTQINAITAGYKSKLDKNSFHGKIDNLMFSLAYFLYSRFYVI